LNFARVHRPLLTPVYCGYRPVDPPEQQRRKIRNSKSKIRRKAQNRKFENQNGRPAYFEFRVWDFLFPLGFGLERPHPRESEQVPPFAGQNSLASKEIRTDRHLIRRLAKVIGWTGQSRPPAA
jgi:hypothetical protein